MFYSPGQLESVFIEVSFSHRCNIVVGCIYKHPKMPVNTFNSNFLSPLLQTLDKEKKTIVLLGDFNIDLLKLTGCIVSNFLDILGSYQILPKILLLTRITETSKTLIDNIFTTTTGCNCVSGNLLHLILDHLPQFLFLQSNAQSRNGVDLSKCPKLF